MARRKREEGEDIASLETLTLEPPDESSAPAQRQFTSGKAVAREIFRLIESNPDCVKVLSAQIDGTPSRAELGAANWHDTTPRDQGVTIIKIIHRR